MSAKAASPRRKPLRPLLASIVLLLASTASAAQFNWKSVPGAKLYEFEVYRGAEVSAERLVRQGFSEDETARVPLEKGVYVYRVRALDAKRQPGDWSQTRLIAEGLESPRLLTPTPEARVTAPPAPGPWELSLEWSFAPEWRGYELHLRHENGENFSVFSETSTAKVSRAWTPGRWRAEIKARTEGKTVVESRGESFEVVAAPTTAPTVAPDAQRFSRNSRWSWELSGGSLFGKIATSSESFAGADAAEPLGFGYFSGRAGLHWRPNGRWSFGTSLGSDFYRYRTQFGTSTAYENAFPTTWNLAAYRALGDEFSSVTWELGLRGWALFTHSPTRNGDSLLREAATIYGGGLSLRRFSISESGLSRWGVILNADYPFADVGGEVEYAEVLTNTLRWNVAAGFRWRKLTRAPGPLEEQRLFLTRLGIFWESQPRFAVR